MNKKFLDATSNLEFVFEEETRNSLINVSALPAVGPQPLVPAWGGSAERPGWRDAVCHAGGRGPGAVSWLRGHHGPRSG